MSLEDVIQFVEKECVSIIEEISADITSNKNRLSPSTQEHVKMLGREELYYITERTSLLFRKQKTLKTTLVYLKLISVIEKKVKELDERV